MTASRRDFMRQSAALVGGVALAPGALRWPPAPTTMPDQIERLGLQLYTVRSLMEQSVERTLQQVANAGYKEVEFAGYFGRTPAQVAAALKQNGLTSPSAHIGLPQLRGPEWAKVVETAAAIGQQYLVLAWIGKPDSASVAGYKGVADTLLTAAETARKAGIRLGYHNHDFELAPLEGTCGLDVLLSQTKGSDIVFELDLYWATKAGADPLAYFAAWPGRFPLVHVKDSAGAPTHKMMEVGQGRINFAALFAKRAQAGIKHFYVEHDNPVDPLASITASAAYLRTLSF